MKIFETPKDCEICGNTDLEVIVSCSTLGGFSQRCCLICSAMGAENKGFAEDYKSIYYDKTTDSYRDYKGNLAKISTKKGLEFDTRTDIIKELNLKPKDKNV